MKETKEKLLQYLGNESQFIIPTYQRTYAWKWKKCQQLWTYSHRLWPTPLCIRHKVKGDVELGVATLNEVPYALGLIWQSLERQLNNNEGTK